MKTGKIIRLVVLTGVLFSTIFAFSQNDAYIDTVCAGSLEYYKVIKSEGSTYFWEISGGGKAVYGVDTKKDSIMVEWSNSTELSEEYIKVTEINKYGRSGEPVELKVLKYPVPTAVISGTDTLYDGNTGSNKIKITLTGTAPWDVVYNDGKTNIPINDVEVSPFTVETRSLSNPPEMHRFTLISIVNASGCTGQVSGAAQVTVSPPIKTSKIFHK